MSKPPTIHAERPPSFVSKSTLAAELDIGESTVDDWVRRGLLPRPIRLGSSPRWRWSDVEAHVCPKAVAETDPFITGLGNVP